MDAGLNEAALAHMSVEIKQRVIDSFSRMKQMFYFISLWMAAG